MECREVHELADSFLAHELPPETNRVMARHLDGCPACRTRLGAQRALREAVRRAFRNARGLGPAPGFTTRLRMTLEEAARQEPVPRGTRTRARQAPAAAVVAATGRRRGG
jgi:anti-sigma factor RsiW